VSLETSCEGLQSAEVPRHAEDPRTEADDDRRGGRRAARRIAVARLRDGQDRRAAHPALRPTPPRPGPPVGRAARH